MARQRKSKGKKSGTGQQPRIEKASRILMAHRAWLLKRGLPRDAAHVIEPLLDLKETYTARPEPTVWTQDVLTELLCEVVPRKMLIEPQDQGDLVPAVWRYLEFLRDTGRWSDESFAVERIDEVMASLSGPVLEAFSDPGRRSFSTNILHYALEQGVDPSDESQMQEFIASYNALSDQERHAVTDTGTNPFLTGPPGFRRSPDDPPRRGHLSLVPDPDDSFDGEGPARWADGVGPLDAWPAFLGEPVDPEQLFSSPALAEGAPIEFDTELMRRAELIMEWLGQGRAVTATGALRRSETGKLLEVLGLSARHYQSMWDIPEIASAWGSLIQTGFIELGSTKAWPGRGFPGTDAENPEQARAMKGVVLHYAVLSSTVGDEEEGPLHAPLLTLMALLKATMPDGFRLPDIDFTQYTDPTHQLDVERLWVQMDLRLLVRYGLITVEHDVYRCPASLMPALLMVLADGLGMAEMTDGLEDL